MQDIMTLAHQFHQNFCAGNQQNQALLHKHINLFLNTGVRASIHKHTHFYLYIPAVDCKIICPWLSVFRF